MKNSTDIQIYKAEARITDADALERLFALVPDNEPERARLGTTFITVMYHPETRRDYWLASDGKLVVCLTIAGIDHETALKIRDLYFQQDNPTFNDVRTLAAVVALATGETIQVLN
jgi:hypothetical protein